MIRRSRLVEALDARDLDAVIASSAANVFYLSGLQSLSQHLLGERAFAVGTPAHDDPVIVLPAVDASIIVDTDVAYERVHTYGDFYLYEGDELAPADTAVRRLKDEHNHDGPVEALLAALQPVDPSAVALERTGLPPDEAAAIVEGLDAEVQGATDLLGDLRRVKTDEEVRRLRRSVSINEAAIEAAIEVVEEGMTERELATRYEREVVDRGGRPLFTVVGFGAHGAYPHAVPGDRQLREGDTIRFDVGCTVENYASDIARTYAFREADPALAAKYEVLERSMQRGIDLVADDADTTAVFEGVVGYVREAGADVFEAFDRNHVGHGIGIDVYDAPTIAPGAGQLHAGMVLCVEPPYYELGTAGLQVEDEVLVTDDGVERLSRCPDELVVVG